jgi:hypothetical protein
MMATQSVTIPAGGLAGQGADCGCGAAAGSCCDLTCLVQPRFFCGQLLTDQDLGALLAWTKGRLALGRYRQGWGVVCGLEVRADPAETSGLLVGPGYAVNCCGDDILVCAEAKLSLAPICQQDKDPCAGMLRPAGAQAGPSVQFGGAGGITLPESEIRIVDLTINYREEPGEPVTALGRGTCTSAAPCEYSRTHERFVLTPRLGVAGADPRQAEADLWRGEYSRCLDVVTQYDALPGATQDALRQWLLRWLDAHPMRQFSFVRDWLWRQDIALTQEVATRILFWIVQDCRNAFLQCGCHVCRDDQGVPLARIWLHSTVDAAGQRTCDVLQIDPYPPYRRPLAPQCWPAPLGEVNLGRAIWQRAAEAQVMLAALGVTVTTEAFPMPRVPADLATQLGAGRLIVPSGGAYQMQVLDDRVVGFLSA